MFEEINANVIVVGDYKAYNKDNPSVPIYVDVLVSPLPGSRQYRCLESSWTVQCQGCSAGCLQLRCTSNLMCSGVQLQRPPAVHARRKWSFHQRTGARRARACR